MAPTPPENNPANPPPLTPQQQAVLESAVYNIRSYPAVQNEGDGATFLDNHPDLRQRMLDRNSVQDRDIRQVYIDWVQSKGFDKNAASIPIPPKPKPAPASPPASASPPAPAPTPAPASSPAASSPSSGAKDLDAQYGGQLSQYLTATKGFAGIDSTQTAQNIEKFKKAQLSDWLELCQMVKDGKSDSAIRARALAVNKTLAVPNTSTTVQDLPKAIAEAKVDELLKEFWKQNGKNNGSEAQFVSYLKSNPAMKQDYEEAVKFAQTRLAVDAVYGATAVAGELKKELYDKYNMTAPSFGDLVSGKKVAVDINAQNKLMETYGGQLSQYLTATKGFAGSDSTKTAQNIEKFKKAQPSNWLELCQMVKDGKSDSAIRARALAVNKTLAVPNTSTTVQDLPRASAEAKVDELLKEFWKQNSKNNGSEAQFVSYLKSDPAMKQDYDEVVKFAQSRLAVDTVHGATAVAGELKKELYDKYNMTAPSFGDLVSGKKVAVNPSAPTAQQLAAWKADFRADFGIDPTVDEVRFATEMMASGSWDQAAYVKYMTTTHLHIPIRPLAGYTGPIAGPSGVANVANFWAYTGRMTPGQVNIAKIASTRGLSQTKDPKAVALHQANMKYLADHQDLESFKDAFKCDFGVAPTPDEQKAYSFMKSFGAWNQTAYVEFMTVTQKHKPIRPLAGYPLPLATAKVTNVGVKDPSEPGALDYAAYLGNDVFKAIQEFFGTVPKDFPGYQQDPRVWAAFKKFKESSQALSSEYGPVVEKILEYLPYILSLLSGQGASSGPSIGSQPPKDSEPTALDKALDKEFMRAWLSKAPEPPSSPPQSSGGTNEDVFAVNLRALPDSAEDSQGGGGSGGDSGSGAGDASKDGSGLLKKDPNWMSTVSTSISVLDRIIKKLGSDISLSHTAAGTGMVAAATDIKNDLMALSKSTDVVERAEIAGQLLAHVTGAAANGAVFTGHEELVLPLVGISLTLLYANPRTQREAIEKAREFQHKAEYYKYKGTPYWNRFWAQMKFFFTDIIPMQYEAIKSGKGTNAVREEILKKTDKQ